MMKRKILIYSSATTLLTFGLAAGLWANTNSDGPTGDLLATEANPSIHDFAQAAPESPQPERPTPPATRPLDPERGIAPERQPEPPMAEDSDDFIQNARDLLDQSVENAQGDSLGAVVDIILDGNTGRIEFVAIGRGESLHVVPPQVLQPHPDGDRLMLDIEADEWEEAPTIQRGELSRLASEAEARDIYRFYGEGYPSPMSTDDIRRVERRPGFGSPSHRWQQRHANEPHVLPGDPHQMRSEPHLMPPERFETHPDGRWEREFGAPHTRDVRRRSAPLPHRTEEPEEFGAREREPVARHVRPRHHRRSGFHAQQRPGVEFGAPSLREEAEMRGALIDHEERLKWASNLVGQPVSDLNQEPIGEVSDFILNLNTGRVNHIISTHNEDQFAIPMIWVLIDKEDEFHVRGTLDDLRRAPRYDERQAQMRPDEAFRYDEATESEFGAPEFRPSENDEGGAPNN